jgi:oligoribonuclease
MIWMDLEMSGLEPEHDVILEMATLVTDADLHVLAEGPDLVIHHDDHVLATMNPWCVEHHGASGLTARVQASTTSMAEAEAQTLAFVRQYSPEPLPLCGNSIHQDRRFLQRHMAQLDAAFHYRNIDVSSVKELVRRWYPNTAIPQKQESHRAMDDIRESIAELRYYRKQVFVAA